MIYNNRSDNNTRDKALLKTLAGWVAIIPICCLSVAISFTNMSVVSVNEPNPFWSGATYMIDLKFLVIGQLVGIIALSAVWVSLIRKNFSRCLEAVFDCICYFIVAVIFTIVNLYTNLIFRSGYTGMFGSPVLPYGEDIVFLFIGVFYLIIFTDTLIVIASKIMEG